MQPISLRNLTEADVPRIYAWLNTEQVARWYYQADLSWNGVMRKWLPRARREDPRTEYFVIGVAGQPAGVIKWYLLKDYPEYYR